MSLAISLLALQYLISGDVLNPGFGFRIVVFKIDLLFEMITTFESFTEVRLMSNYPNSKGYPPKTSAISIFYAKY